MAGERHRLRRMIPFEMIKPNARLLLYYGPRIIMSGVTELFSEAALFAELGLAELGKRKTLAIVAA